MISGGGTSLGGPLAVSGARYSRRSFDDVKEKSYSLLRNTGDTVVSGGTAGSSNTLQTLLTSNTALTFNQISGNTSNTGGFTGGTVPMNPARSTSAAQSGRNANSLRNSSTGSSLASIIGNSNILRDGASDTAESVSVLTSLAGSTVKQVNYETEYKYWKYPPQQGNLNKSQFSQDLVIIHVCDENQDISKDFCCKRDILVNHMRYFQKFLNENPDNGYDDIDISVHCDVEIFEWLMNYIHHTEDIHTIDKSILVSILISSEFLQMDPLVDLCVGQITRTLNDVIKLPIDLSCISEKLVNRIAHLIHPKLLSEIRDRKDKIVTKLYKRRVELDFSRKGSTIKTNSTQSITRTIAASLTCCRYCGMVYLDNYSSSLICRKSPASIDHRGCLASRHSSIIGWSLTSYLKTLHAGGMGWDAIYWHVWAACVVLRVDDIVISALEADRYTIEPDGILLRRAVNKDSEMDFNSPEDVKRGSSRSPPKPSQSSQSPSSGAALFTLDCESEGSGDLAPFCKMLVSKAEDSFATAANGYLTAEITGTGGITASLNPLRPADVLTNEIFDLLCTQMKYIVGLAYRSLIQGTMAQIIKSAGGEVLQHPEDIFGALGLDEEDMTNGLGRHLDDPDKRRGRSPSRGGRVMSASMEPRKTSHSVPSKNRIATSATPAATAGSAAAGADSAADDSQNDSDAELPPDNANSGAPKKARSGLGERRTRSSSSGAKIASMGSNSSKSATAAADKLSRGIKSVDEIKDPLISRQIAILRSLPPDLHHKVMNQQLTLNGVWILPCLLEWTPVGMEEMLQTVSESQLSERKKLEWDLDIMREYDEKKVDRLERLLVTRRNSSFDTTIAKKKEGSNRGSLIPPAGRSGGTAAAGSGGGGGGGQSSTATRAIIIPAEYYKDRGRQAFRSII